MIRLTFGCFFQFAEWLVDHKLVWTLLEVDFALEGLAFGGGRGKDRIFILHNLLIGIK